MKKLISAVIVLPLFAILTALAVPLRAADDDQPASQSAIRSSKPRPSPWLPFPPPLRSLVPRPTLPQRPTEPPKVMMVAKISSPHQGEQIGQQLIIKGTAAGKLFSYYYLEMLPQRGVIQKPHWIRISPDRNQPVKDGVLEKVNLTTFPNGDYTLRLVVVGNPKRKTESIKEIALVTDLRLVHGGSLEVKAPKKARMSEITVSTAPQHSRGIVGGKRKKIVVSDNRGSFVGWSLTGTFSDFKLEDDKSIVIPVAHRLKIKPSKVITVKGSPEGVKAGTEQVVVDTNEPVLFMLAEQGHGNGVYSQTAKLDLAVPANPVAGKYRLVLSLTVQ